MKIILNRGAWRVLAVLMCLVGAFGLRAQEQGVNKLYISNFNITSTAPQQVAVELENTPELVGLQFNVILPEGVKILETKRNSDRFNAGQNMTFSPNKNNQFLVTSGNRKPFNGTEGVLVWLTVQASEQVVSAGMSGTIELTNIIYSSATGQRLPGDRTSTTQVTVQPGSGVLSVNSAEFVMNPSQSRTIEVSLANDFNVQGLQMDITLPTGFSIANGEVKFTNRISNGAAYTLTPRADGRTYGLVIVDYNANDIINEGEGAIFTFDVIAPFDFNAESGIVKFGNFQMSNRQNKTIYGTGCDIKIINGKVAYDQALERIDALQQKLTGVLASIAEECPLVADNFKGTELQDRIDALKASVESAYESMTLTQDYENIMAPAAAIESDIDAYLTSAKSAQAAEEKRRADNKAAYEAVLGDIAALQAQLDAAKAEIAEKYAAFRDEQAEAAVQAALDAAKTQAEEAYNSVAEEGVYAYTIDKPAMEAQIAALVNDAKARADESDRQAANKAAYDADMASIANLQAQLNAAKAEIAEKYPAFRDEQAEEAAQTAINALKDAVQQAYDAVAAAGNYDYNLDTTAVEAQIAALITTAADKAAAEADREGFNKSKYEADLAIIANLQAQLNVAKAEIAEKYADYANADEEAAAQKAIDDLKAAVEAAYAAVVNEGVYGYKLDTAAAEALINALVPAAQARADEAARQAANKAAYDADMASLAALQAQLDAAKAEIAEKYADYANADEEATAQKAIDDLKAAVEAAYAAVANEGVYGYKLDTAAAEALINALVPAAQSRANESARQAANKAAYEADLAIIANLQAQFDAAKAEVREKYKNFVDRSSEDYIQTQLDIMKLGVNNAYAAVATAGTYSYNLETSNLEARIEALVPAAAEAYRQDCNEKAYDADLALLNKLMDEFDVALDTVRALYPSYIDSEYVTSMRARLNDARDACDKEYAAVEEEGLYKSQVNYESLSLAIQQMIESIKTVGIDSVVLKDVDLTDAAIYTVDGQCHNAPVKGQINIIRLSDGNVIKVMVK